MAALKILGFLILTLPDSPDSQEQLQLTLLFIPFSNISSSFWRSTVFPALAELGMTSKTVVIGSSREAPSRSVRS